MNGVDALLDSNIIIYFSKKELDPAFLNKFEAIFISVISYMEVLGYNFKDKREEAFVNELISLFHIKFINQKIANHVIEIRKNGQIKLPDAIIAGTAIAEDLCLVTRNTEDFKKTECSIFNPFNVSEIS